MTKVNKNEVFSTICRTEEKYIIDEYNDHWYKIEYQPDMFGWIYGGYYKTEADNLSANSYYEIMVNQLWWELYNDTVKETNGSECFEKVLAGKSPFNRIEYMGRNDDGPPSMTYSLLYNYWHYSILQVGSSYYWESSEYIEDFPNSLSVKIGMDISDLKKIFGLELVVNDYIGFMGPVLKFKVKNNKLESIIFYYEGT